MDWTAGYASDVQYTAGYYADQSPGHLNFLCVVRGYEPIPIDDGFNWLELGCGRGVTASVLASLYPQGRFYAVDFNPAHVAEAATRTAEAGLDNLQVLEAAFADVAGGKLDLPQFDFITLHGVYTWVNAANRQAIVDILGRYLRPGGIVYVSYNAMPGWTAALPMQRMMVDMAACFPGTSESQLQKAIGLLQSMERLGGGFFQQNPVAAARLKSLPVDNSRYLVHEFMHRHWEPLYHADVAESFAEAKLEFAGSTDLTQAFAHLFLSKEKLELLEGIPQSPVRETARDFLMGGSFRKDVFVRGLRPLRPGRRIALLRAVELARLVPLEKLQKKLKMALGEVELAASVFEVFVKQLQSGKANLGTMTDIAGEQGIAPAQIIQAACLLVAAGQLHMMWGGSVPAEKEAARRLNRIIARETEGSDDIQTFSAPNIAAGVNLGYFERLYLLVAGDAVQSGSGESYAERAAQILKERGQILQKQGQSVTTDAAVLAELESQFQSIEAERGALFRLWGLVD